MSSAHEEIWDEWEERGIEAVDRREVCQEGKCHAWKEQTPFYNCHINHNSIYKNTKTMLYTGPTLQQLTSVSGYYIEKRID